LCATPVVMLTSSKSEEDIMKTYQSGATSYIQKPVNYEEFVKVIVGFNVYWNIITKLPQRS
jgi:DNA-binding response OmpR family regulator